MKAQLRGESAPRKQSLVFARFTYFFQRSVLITVVNCRSKDYTIKFWDLVSGVCVKTYSSHFGGAVMFFNFQLTPSDGYQYMSFYG
jgi:hypothetical protein